MKVLGLIPAKGLSDRVPYKNLADLCGRPLIEWSVLSALESKAFDVVAVSTEDSRVAHVARLAGAEVIERPAALAQSDSPSFDTVIHAFGVMPCDLLILLQPTSPLRTAEDIVSSITVMDMNGADSLISVTDGPTGAGRRLFHKDGLAGRLRPVENVLEENGAIFGLTGEAFASGKDFYSGIVYRHWMPKERSLDIDTLHQLELARSLMSARAAA